jgi:2-polyprenyl-3-methyl-5-hydroxy-6-metoxy-1,4-benzoquinol methylase
MKNKAIEVFNQWAQNGKDEGMKKNHFDSYIQIKNIIKKEFQDVTNIAVADIGCGNGWATEDLLKESFITKCCGYDGAEKMIEKAQSSTNGPSFFHTNLNNWEPNQKFDIIYSMEVIYYLKNPQDFIQKCYKKWLNPNGLFIAGIDHYKENNPSLSWPKDLNILMQTKSIKDWRTLLAKNNFSNCNVKQVNKKDDWSGTLIFWGRKDAL